MKIIYYFILVYLFFIPTASAIGIADTLADGFVSGFDRTVVSITNQFYDLAGVNSTEAQTALGNTMIAPNDFLSNPFIQQEKDFSAFWYVIIYVMFLIAGGILLFKEEATQNTDMGLDGDSWRNKYFTIAIMAPMIWAFYLIGFKWLFSFEYVLSKSAFLELTDFIPLNHENAIAYLFLGVMILINILFFYIRYLVIGIIAGWFLFIVLSMFFPKTKIYGTLLINYGLLMLFSRFILVLIFIGGFGLFKQVSYLPQLEYTSYAIVLLIAVLFELVCILYPIVYVIAHSPIKIIKVRR